MNYTSGYYLKTPLKLGGLTCKVKKVNFVFTLTIKVSFTPNFTPKRKFFHYLLNLKLF